MKKKLRLSRETIRKLDALEGVVGGQPKTSVQNLCDGTLGPPSKCVCPRP